jgi:hypothetical protein
VADANMSLVLGAVIATAAVGAFWVVRRISGRPVEVYDMKATLKRVGFALVSVFVLGVIAETGVISSSWWGLVLGLWSVVFMWSMAWNCLRWTFGVSDVDKALGPIVSATTALAAFGVGRLLGDDDPRPQLVQHLIEVWGLSTVCGLAFCELVADKKRGRSGSTV